MSTVSKTKKESRAEILDSLRDLEMTSEAFRVDLRSMFMSGDKIDWFELEGQCKGLAKQMHDLYMSLPDIVRREEW